MYMQAKNTGYFPAQVYIHVMTKIHQVFGEFGFVIQWVGGRGATN